MRRVVIVSDLHLGVGAAYNVEDFYAGSLFQAFLRDPLLMPDEGGQVELVLLGDTFDLWQTTLKDAEYQADTTAQIPLAYTEQDEVARLRRIHLAHPQFFVALREFLEGPGRRLTIVIGSHDHSLVRLGAVQDLVRSLISDKVKFAVNCDEPHLGLYADHGSQCDANNTYDDFEAFGVDGECPGYFFVRLFWNRMETVEPRSSEVLPFTWHSVWHHLLPLVRSNPAALAKALLFWVQYRGDGRVRECVNVLAAEPGQPFAQGSLGIDGPDLLAKGVVQDGHVFSEDLEVEHVLRKAYHTEPQIRDLVDSLRPADALPVPPADERVAAGAFALAKASRGLEGQDGAEALFQQNPIGRTAPLSVSGYRYVVFGHTHVAGKVQLSNGAWYMNTGSWSGRHVARVPMVVADDDGQEPRVRLGWYDGSPVEFE